MTMNPDEKTTLFGKGPSRSKRGFFVRISDDKFQGKEDTIQHTLHAVPSDEISTASSEYSMESFLPHEKFHPERKKIQWKENPIIEEEDDEEEAKTQSNHVSRGVTFAVNDDMNKHEDSISPKVRSYSVFEKAKSMRVTVSNFGKNFVSHLFGSEEEKKRQMRMSKFILVVDDAFHEDEDEEEQASAAMETAKQGLLAEFIEEVKAAESALWFLWKFPENKTQDPNTYLQAATEVIALTIALSWILTIIFNPSVIANNPLLDRLDYNNVCVGWDTFPANIVGVVGTSIGVHLGLRFVHLNASRTKLLGDKLSERSKTYGLSRWL